MMNRYFRSAGYLLPVFFVFTSVALLGARAKPSGDDPFTPTKRSWLCLAFNAVHAVHFKTHGYAIYAFAANGTGGDEVTLFCSTNLTTDRAEFNAGVQHARTVLQLLAEKYGFDDWLTIKELVRMID